MSIFSKNNKKRLALALACASILGNKTQAMKEPQSSQALTAVGEATSRNNKPFQQGLSKKQKLAIVATVASLAAATAIGFTIWGVKKHLDSKNAPDKNKNNKDGNKKSIENNDTENCNYIDKNNYKKEEKINNNEIKNKKILISSENSAEKDKMKNLSEDLKYCIDFAFSDKKQKMFKITEHISFSLREKLQQEKGKIVFEEITGDSLKFFTQDLFKKHNLNNYKIIYVVNYVRSEFGEGDELQEGIYLSLKNETEINEQNISKITLLSR